MSASGISTPDRSHKTLRSIVQAVMALNLGDGFRSLPSTHYKRRMGEVQQLEGGFGVPKTILYAGISAKHESTESISVSVAVHDSVYSIDYSVHILKIPESSSAHYVSDLIAEYVLMALQKYEREHLCKFLCAGLPADLLEWSPRLCSRLWAEMDVIPIVLHVRGRLVDEGELKHLHWTSKTVDEQADSMARRSIMFFGPTMLPHLHVGWRNVVEIDAGYHIHIATVDDFRKTVGVGTWNAVMKYATELKGKKVRFAYFSSTPQGGGVALMRHALVRFFKTYVPKPNPAVFRITKNNHNILQGVASPTERITLSHKAALTTWIQENAHRYWLSPGGPLSPPSQGGAHVIIIDDPQMPGLIPLIKKITPDRPVVYRSHIEIRSDLVAKEGSPQREAWGHLWEDIKLADAFISHPVTKFVPHDVPKEMVGYMPAATDWLDGLNKPMGEWDLGYYGHIFNRDCEDVRMAKLQYPARRFIAQIARFDPSKGIPDAIKAYAKFRRELLKGWPTEKTPQLLICGHGSIDDPDATQIYDSTLTLLETTYPDLVPDIILMRLPPSDQLLNTLLTTSHIALQLSTREGFEIKVSEALHKGKPIIATRAGGIPLQIQHNKNGFLVEVGDAAKVAEHLYELWTDEELYARMSKAARLGVSDEVSTVGNALGWLWIVREMHGGGNRKLGGGWVNDLAREGAGEGYKAGENRLPRDLEGFRAARGE
ncbi:MAG: hypothetical protein M1839_001277 [Geoglossum umbratile]|nr:MAG: hypothetical protein M1839_001277 [Geoglossum umbratile]